MTSNNVIGGAFVLSAHSLGRHVPECYLQENLEIVGSSIASAAINTDRVYVGFNSGSGQFEAEARNLKRYIDDTGIPGKIVAVDMEGIYRDALASLELDELKDEYEFNGGINIALARMLGANLLGAREGEYVLVLDEGMTVNPALSRRLERISPEDEVLVVDWIAGTGDGAVRGGMRNGIWWSREGQKERKFLKLKGRRMSRRLVRDVLDRTREKAAGSQELRELFKQRYVGGRHLARVEGKYCTEFQVLIDPLRDCSLYEDRQIYGRVSVLGREYVLSANPKRVLRKVEWAAKYAVNRSISQAFKMVRIGDNPWELCNYDSKKGRAISRINEELMMEEYGGLEEFIEGLGRRARSAAKRNRRLQKYSLLVDSYLEIVDSARAALKDNSIEYRSP